MSGNRKYVKYVFDEEPAFYETYTDPRFVDFPDLRGSEEAGKLAAAQARHYEAKRSNEELEDVSGRERLEESLQAAYPEAVFRAQQDRYYEAKRSNEEHMAVARALADCEPMPDTYSTSEDSGRGSYYEAKRDQGKVQPSLVPFEAIEAVARIMTDALKENGGKYERDSWRTVPDAQRRYTDALLRHVSDLMIHGNLLHSDEESGSLTVAHLATNAMILLALALEQDKENQE